MASKGARLRQTGHNRGMQQIALANSFVDALAHLDSGDIKRAATFVDKLIADPTRAGFNFETVHDAHDRAIRSARVSQDLRTIAYVDDKLLLLLFVGHHDLAYEWARTRCIECHPVTGELQLVRDPPIAQTERAHTPDSGSPTGELGQDSVSRPASETFGEYSDEYLLSLGVPPSWLATIRMIRSDDMFLSVAPDLPDEVSDRLLRLMGGELVAPAPVCEDECTWGTPGARRWICTVEDGAGLCQALDDAGIAHGLAK